MDLKVKRSILSIWQKISIWQSSYPPFKIFVTFDQKKKDLGDQPQDHDDTEDDLDASYRTIYGVFNIFLILFWMFICCLEKSW